MIIYMINTTFRKLNRIGINRFFSSSGLPMENDVVVLGVEYLVSDYVF